MSGRVLVAGVGNVLRRDDGFGVAVARRLIDDGGLGTAVDVIETGTGGMTVVQQLMDGYQTLIVLDAVDRGAPPGTVLVLEPVVPDLASLPAQEVQALLSNLHLTEPSRVFLFARALGVLPARVLLVGCQPRDCDTLDDRLSAPVAAAVPVAAATVRELVATALECTV